MAIQASLEVELEDRPGQLRSLLGVFEEANANIISVTHIHGRKANSHVPVEIIFTAAGKEALATMDAALRKGGWHVVSLEKVIQLRRVTVGLVGNIIRTRSVEVLIDRVDALGANVSKFSMNMPCQSGESSALITFEAEDEAVIAKAMDEIGKICGQNNLLLIKPVE
ncbi:ACT domain protein [uncultured archaeon]|nr:ACT domain protein [uncultured archaeon]